MRPEDPDHDRGVRVDRLSGGAHGPTGAVRLRLHREPHPLWQHALKGASG